MPNLSKRGHRPMVRLKGYSTIPVAYFAVPHHSFGNKKASRRFSNQPRPVHAIPNRMCPAGATMCGLGKRLNKQPSQFILGATLLMAIALGLFALFLL